MFNRVILAGNLTRDIELRYAQSGTAIANTGIASTRKYTSNGEKKEETLFIDLSFFGRTAEVANQYLRKGSKVLIEGKLKLGQWEKDGQKRSKHTVSVENMTMLDSRQEGGAINAQPQQQGYQQPSYQPQQQQAHTDYQPRQQEQPQVHTDYQPRQQEQPQAPTNGQQQINIDDDDIPF